MVDAPHPLVTSRELTRPRDRSRSLLLLPLLVVGLVLVPAASGGEIGRLKEAGDISKVAQGHNPIWDLVVFQGDLYALVATRPMGKRGGALLKLEGRARTRVYSFARDDGVYSMCATDSLLYVAGSDTNSGRHGNVYLFDGKRMEVRQVKPSGLPAYRADHNVAVAVFEGSIFVTNALKSPGAGRGRIFRSDDAGQTWSEDYREGSNWHPYGLHLSKRHGLFAAMGQVMRRENARAGGWEDVAVEGQNLAKVRHRSGLQIPVMTNQIVDFGAFGEDLFACGDEAIWRYEPEKGFVRSARVPGKTFWRLSEHDGRLYAVCGERILHAEQKARYAAPGAEFIEPDGKNDAEVWALDSPSGTWRRAAVLKEDRALSVASLNGRLYVGTGARGRIYASRKR